MGALMYPDVVLTWVAEVARLMPTVEFRAASEGSWRPGCVRLMVAKDGIEHSFVVTSYPTNTHLKKVDTPEDVKAFFAAWDADVR